MGLKIGTREYSQAHEKEKEDEEREKNIEEKIRILRKQAGKKAQRREKKENPAPNRKKINNNKMSIRNPGMWKCGNDSAHQGHGRQEEI